MFYSFCVRLALDGRSHVGVFPSNGAWCDSYHSVCECSVFSVRHVIAGWSRPESVRIAEIPQNARAVDVFCRRLLNCDFV